MLSLVKGVLNAGLACIVILFILFLLPGCAAEVKAPVLPPNVFTSSRDTALHNVNGCWMLKGTKYSGYIVETDGGVKLAQLPVVDGRENGIAYGWYAGGKRKYERSFADGNREGVHKGWYENGTLAFEYYFHGDKYEGVQKSWFESGHQWQSLTYVKGYEEGKQRSWNDSGRLINNFTVKKGKLYGVIGRYDCVSVIKK